MTGEESTGEGLLATMIISGVTAGPGINSSKLRGIYKHSKDVLSTTASPRKVALYSSKITNIKKTVANKISDELFDGAKSIVYEYLDYHYNINPLW